MGLLSRNEGLPYGSFPTLPAQVVNRPQLRHAEELHFAWHLQTRFHTCSRERLHIPCLTVQSRHLVGRWLENVPSVMAGAANGTEGGVCGAGGSCWMRRRRPLMTVGL